MFNAPTLSAKGLLQFAQGVLVLRKTYRSMLSPPMFDSPRAIRWDLLLARRTRGLYSLRVPLLPIGLVPSKPVMCCMQTGGLNLQVAAACD